MVYLSRIQKIYIIIGLCSLCSAIPAVLTQGTMQAWLTRENVDVIHIGIFALTSLPYSFKFVWAPFLDHFSLGSMGLRKSWLMVTPIIITVLIYVISLQNPKDGVWYIGLLCFFVSFFSATYDAVFDAYKIEVLSVSELATAAAIASTTYRVGMLLASSGALLLTQYFSWNSVYAVLASTILLSSLIALWAEDTVVRVRKPFEIKTYFEPFLDFFKKAHLFSTLSFVFFYKFDILFAVALLTNFLMSLGFSNVEIGYAKGVGVFANLFGAMVGAYVIKRIGLYRSLWHFQILQILSISSLLLLSYYPGNILLCNLAVICENFFSGMGNAAYGTYIMSVCQKKYSVTHYAVLSSLMGMARQFTGYPSSIFAKYCGWHYYFIISILFGVPSLILLRRKNFLKTIQDVGAN